MVYGFNDDLIESSAVAVLHHQQPVQIVIATQHTGSVVYIVNIIAEFKNVAVFAFQVAVSQIPVALAVRVKEFAHHPAAGAAFFIDIHCIGAVGSENSYTAAAIAPQLRKYLMFQVSVKRIIFR